MRKNLLLLSALAIALPAFSTAPKKHTKKSSQLPVKTLVTNPLSKTHKVKDLMKPEGLISSPRFAKSTRAEETLNMQWGYCSDPYTVASYEDNEVNQAIYVNPDFTEMLDGAELRNVLAANPVDANAYDPVTYIYENPVKRCKVWVRESLDEDPIAEGEGEMGPNGFYWSSIALSQPYTIKKDKPFYVGVSYTLPADNLAAYGYITDFIYPQYDDTNLIYSSFEGYAENWDPIFGSEKKWTNVGFYDGNACIRLDVFGDNLPQNIANIDDVYVPAYVAPGEKVEVMLAVTNKASNSIKDVEISFQLDGEEVQTSTVEILGAYDEDDNLIPAEIAYGYTGIAVAEFNSPDADGNYGYSIKITKINGDAENNSDSEATGYLLCLAEGYHKNVVVEEGTGLWCGYCPVGWAGMEYIKENFTEEGVIGVALHEGDILDVLDAGAFSPLLKYFDGFPSCFYNRDFSYSGYPSPEDFEADLPELIEIPACVSIEAELEATDDKNTVILSTKSAFSIGGADGEYEIGYTVLEDNVGPYMQSNYLSGEPDDESYGFGSKGDPCRLTFNDVARNCSEPMGIEGSLPAVEKGNSYEYSCDVTLNGVNNVDNCRIVAMVINKKNGIIENATVVKYPSAGSGVNMMATEKGESFVRVVKGGILIDGDNNDVNVYSASGMKIAKPNGYRIELPAGVYVVTRGAEFMKVVVK